MKKQFSVRCLSILILFVKIKSHTSKQLYAGDNCNLPSGDTGTCTNILDCQEALEQIKYSKFPQICGFEGTKAIVCCSDQSTQTATSTIKTKETTVQDKRSNIPGKISSQKCTEYSKYVFVKTKPPIPIPGEEEISVNECGFTAVPLIIGGEAAKRKEFPHMVSIGFETGSEIKWGCGGTLISEQFVITAAHCLYSREYGDPTVARIGVTELKDSFKRQDLKIVKTFYPSDYNPPSYYNDIALLKLEKYVILNPYVRPACLFVNEKINKQHAIATGWGDTQFAGFSADNLQKVTLNLLNQQSCNQSYKREIQQSKLSNGIIDRTQICAGDTGKDTCQGDSGGPLQIYSKTYCMYEIIGITSFGKACGLGKVAGVYTRVSAYIKWIEDIVWP